MGKWTCRLGPGMALAAASFSLFGCGAGTTPPIASVSSGLSVSSQVPAAAAPESGPIPRPSFATNVDGLTVAGDQILVKFTPDQTADSIRSLLSSMDSTPLYYLRKMDWYLISVPTGMDVQAFEKQLETNPAIASTHWNEIMKGVRVQ